MKAVIALVENLKKDPISEVINSRTQEFEELGKKSKEEIFKELCFCLLTANFSASGGIKIQNEIEDGFSVLPKEEIAAKLRELGHRFPNVRAEYIYLARASFLKINFNSENVRGEVVENIKGLGMKESSHFLRNIGFSDYAIIDFHIVDFLVKQGLLEKPKVKQINPKKYLEIETLLREIAEATDLSLGELDLYLWYLETGKVLK
jgi:N-glycosylase/DNA lyase